MEKNLFAESPCFENESLTLEISTLCEEIIAHINICLVENNFKTEIKKSLLFTESVFRKYRIYFTKDWDQSDELMNETRTTLENIYNITKKPEGFINVPTGKKSVYINLLRVKTRQLIRLFYRLEKEESIDTKFQKSLFSSIAAFYFYLGIYMEEKEESSIKFLKL